MFFSEFEKEQITNAIKRAEGRTSGEIKVHVEEYCPTEDPMERANAIFKYLYLDHTAYRNGVLFYLSIRDRKFAILGDIGIHQAAGSKLWEEEKNILLHFLKQGETVRGLVEGITFAGETLAELFPYDLKGSKNEISNDISFGK